MSVCTAVYLLRGHPDKRITPLEWSQILPSDLIFCFRKTGITITFKKIPLQKMHEKCLRDRSIACLFPHRLDYNSMLTNILLLNRLDK